MNKLIIAEKPSVALRLALSLGDGQPKRSAFNGVSYYELQKGHDTLFVVAAAGHLFTLRQKSKEREIPIFDIEWIASYKVNDSSYFTKRYLDTIAEIGKRCTEYVNACDYDIEGTVIGTNIIKYVVSGDVNSGVDSDKIKRMKFSTTTRQDLLSAYDGLEGFDSSNFDAGEARHMLDWMWGINLSRALIHAMTAVGAKKILSIGRVQGPTLSILSEREAEIRDFVPKDFWRILIVASGIEFENTKGNFFDKAAADDALKRTEGATVTVKSIDRKENNMRPYPPFDLTSLQLEASRVFGIDPSRTLAIAQSLYEKSYISYPRTTSQKLPYTLNLPRIIGMLAKNEKYKAHAEMLISGSRFRPAEGAKADEAHPAIYPTGEEPKRLEGEEERIYDLITRRFLACFAEYAVSDSTRIVLGATDEEYAASGSIVKKQGWMEVYGYYKPKEAILPEMQAGSEVTPERIYSKKGVTEPPKRYGKASLIALLEKKNLGTKATRAEIIDTLFRRGYIKGTRLEVTALGLSVYSALKKYCAQILDEDLTRKLESDMEDIMRGNAKESAVIEEGKGIIRSLVSAFKANEKGIGEELRKGLKESEAANALGKCPKCGGNLVIKRSSIGKNFVGCSNWPECSVTYPLPQGAGIYPTGKVCELCHTPIVKVFRKGKRVFQMDLDPNCSTKRDWEKPKPQEGAASAQGTQAEGAVAHVVPPRHAGKVSGKRTRSTTPRARKKTSRNAGRNTANKQQ